MFKDTVTHLHTLHEKLRDGVPFLCIMSMLLLASSDKLNVFRNKFHDIEHVNNNVSFLDF